MEREEFESSELFKDMIFIGENVQRSYYDFSPSEKEIVFTVRAKNGVEKQYDPYMYFKHVITFWGRAAATEIDENEHIKILYMCKANAVMQIETINRMLLTNPLLQMFRKAGICDYK